MDVFSRFLLEAESEGTGGGVTATATEEAPSSSAPGEPGEAEVTASTLPLDQDGNIIIKPSKKAKAKGAPFDPMAMFDESGVFNKGKFDSGDHKITRELVEGHPALLNVLTAEHDHQAEITRMRQGKIELVEKMTQEQYDGIDWALGAVTREDGTETVTLAEDTLKLLRGRPIGDYELEFLAQLLDRATVVEKQANEAWTLGWDEKSGGKMAEIIEWVAETYSPDDVKIITDNLTSQKLRDGQMERLVANYQKAHEGESDPSDPSKGPAKKPLRTGNVDGTTPEGSGVDDNHPAGTKAVGVGVFSEDLAKRSNEIVGENFRAGDSKSKLAAVDAKLHRTIQRYGS